MTYDVGRTPYDVWCMTYDKAIPSLVQRSPCQENGPKAPLPRGFHHAPWSTRVPVRASLGIQALVVIDADPRLLLGDHHLLLLVTVASTEHPDDIGKIPRVSERNVGPRSPTWLTAAHGCRACTKERVLSLNLARPWLGERTLDLEINEVLLPISVLDRLAKEAHLHRRDHLVAHAQVEDLGVRSQGGLVVKGLAWQLDSDLSS